MAHWEGLAVIVILYAGEEAEMAHSEAFWVISGWEGGGGG